MPIDRVCCPSCHVPAPFVCNCDEPEHEDVDALVEAEFAINPNSIRQVPR